jgi:aquaporin Z
MNSHSYITEFIGTFLLVLIGCGVAAMMGTNPSASIATALAFGVVLIVLVYAFALASGANFNPAVSLGLAVDGRMSYTQMGGYWIAQFAGAILAAALLLYLIGASSGLGASIGSLTGPYPWKAVLVEAIITFILVFTVLVVTANSQYSAVSGLAIGLALFVAVLFGFYLTGGSANPARSLGPALFTNNLSTVWIYFVGPFLGALVAALVYRYVYSHA